MRTGLCGALLGLQLAGPAAKAESLPSISISAYGGEVAVARQVVQACASSAAGCDGRSLPVRQQVQDGRGNTFDTSWQWLQNALDQARTASTPERVKAMKSADAHLEELLAEAEPTRAGSGADFSRAKAAANAALAREEFRTSEGPDWTERQIAKLQDWILRLFTGMDRIGKRAPWLAPLVEWGCFGLALAGLLWFVRQSLARQALRISLTDGAALAAGGDRDSADWAKLAQERAAARDWREAVHCLYWAAIALMEGRRAWRPNATRTPREYLRLLRPGSEGQVALRELTRAFERIWYGHEEAQAPQYEAALRSYEALEAARPERVRASGEDVSGQPFAAAGGT